MASASSPSFSVVSFSSIKTDKLSARQKCPTVCRIQSRGWGSNRSVITAAASFPVQEVERRRPEELAASIFSK
nr:plastid-lipid associated protein PAP / fibrillin family protein [Tanacetum cinerariifolium]